MPDKSAGSPSSDEFRASHIPAPLETALHERYEIVRETGHGASAIVYLARDLKHERLVALKMLSPDVSATAGERFLREIQLAAGMQHPHILPMYDSGVADGRLYFVMPFVDGGSLRQRLEAEPQLPLAEALRIAHDIALALAFAHDQGVVHRDVKPENIMFYHGHACLADFGVARAMEELDTRVTAHGMIVGTPAYMSPEQLTDGGFDGRSDVYSLACVLYETLAGVHAFSGSTPRELLRQRLRTPPPALMTHREDAPKFIEDLLARSLAASPDARYADARQFASALERAQQELIKPTRRSAPRRAIEAMPRHPMAWAGSLTLVLALGGMAASPIRSMVRGRGNSRADVRAAAEAYTKGKTALERWDLTTAERELSNAVTANPKMAEAQLRLARTLELEHVVDSDPYRLATARLATMRGKLNGRDSLFAEAAIALGARQYPAACETFARLRATDSLDALAWYGIGDCLSLDSAVVKDPNSASGWSFRTSWHTAVQAYMKAALIEPGVHRALSFGPLAKLLIAAPTQIRRGNALNDRSVMFGAHPALDADTIAYTPFPFADLISVKERAVPPTLTDALRANREQLVTFAHAWVAASPDNADAYEALAVGYEMRGTIGTDSGSAGGALASARKFATDNDQQLKLASIAVRLDVKRGEFAQARELADSILRATDGRQVGPDEATRLAGLAALTGQIERAAKLHAIAFSEYNGSINIAPELTAASSRLFIRAAAGVCDDSLLIMRRQIDQLLDSYSEPARRNTMRQQLLNRSMSLAFPCLRERALDGMTSGSPLLAMQRAFLTHDSRRVHAILDSLDVVRVVARPGDISLDYTVQEAWLRAAVGDTLGATRQIDRVLDALPTLGPWAVREEAQSLAVGRALALRADLARASGDVATQHQRAQQALALWQQADASLAPTVNRLRALASAK